jgi:hypothetical protein
MLLHRAAETSQLPTMTIEVVAIEVQAPTVRSEIQVPTPTRSIGFSGPAPTALSSDSA